VTFFDLPPLLGEVWKKGEFQAIGPRGSVFQNRAKLNPLPEYALRLESFFLKA
jgi:hypothetical protein